MALNLNALFDRVPIGRVRILWLVLGAMLLVRSGFPSVALGRFQPLIRRLRHPIIRALHGVKGQ